MDCKWGNETLTADCNTERLKLLKGSYSEPRNKRKKGKKEDEDEEEGKYEDEDKVQCYRPSVLEYLQAQKYKKEIKAFYPELLEKVNELSEIKDQDALWDWEDSVMDLFDFKSMRKSIIYKKKRKRSFRRIVRALRNSWHDDFEDILRYMKFEKTRVVTLPVIDGLYGGKHCVRNVDNSKLSMIDFNLFTYLLRKTYHKKGRGQKV